RRQSIHLILGPAVFDRDVLTLDIAGILEALAKYAQTIGVHVRRCGSKKPDHRRRRLLCLRAERPRRRRPTEQRDERAARPHSITSSARAMSCRGTSTPSALADLRLMISSTLVTCWTGRSPGFSPLRMRPA